MTTGIATLAEFLLARVAEDEAKFGGPKLDPECRSGDYNEAYIDWLHELLMAECKATREIVTRYEFACDQVEAHAVNQTSDDGWEKIAGELELCVRSLGAVYADHPDFREEWRG